MSYKSPVTHRDSKRQTQLPFTVFFQSEFDAVLKLRPVLSRPVCDVESSSPHSCSVARRERLVPARIVSAGQAAIAVFIQPGCSITSLFRVRLWAMGELCLFRSDFVVFVCLCFSLTVFGCFLRKNFSTPILLQALNVLLDCSCALLQFTFPRTPSWNCALIHDVEFEGAGGERCVCSTCFKL